MRDEATETKITEPALSYVSYSSLSRGSSTFYCLAGALVF